MIKIFSISEIVRASDNILNNTKKNPKIKIKIKKINNLKPLLLVNETLKKESVSSNDVLLDNLTVDDLNIKNNYEIKKETKEKIIDEIYNFFKKKIKKNTLKTLVDQQIEIKRFKEKIHFLNENKKIFDAKNKNVLLSLNKIIEDKKILEAKNIDLEFNLVKITKDKRILEIKNIDLLSDLNKITEEKKILIEKNETLHKSNLQKVFNNEKLIELNKKLRFSQDENLRLSNDLFISREKNKVVKKQLHDFDIQKNQISDQIQELNNSINESNLIAPSFNNEISKEATEDLKNLNKDDMSSLNESINKIFKKL